MDPASETEPERISAIQAAVNERDKLSDEGDLVVVNAVIDTLGVDAEIVWFPKVTINGVVYTPESDS